MQLLLTLNVKSAVVSGTNTFREHFCCKYFVFFNSFIKFHANKVKFNALIHIF